ncbi:MAG: hypothetical protein K8J08_02175 [Thermoanaerobaculia bacterium]|nr:hypothetical protein [Thermoanaerobaculia bacterium]
MKRSLIALGWIAGVLLLLVFVNRAGNRKSEPGPSAPSHYPPTGLEETQDGVLYGRVTTNAGTTYEGRLRFGGDEEALWSHYFNGTKDQNRWASYVPPEQLPKEVRPIRVFGITLAKRVVETSLTRPFMAQFGEIAVIEASGRDVRVTLKSGSTYDLDRFAASDFDDGLRIWDSRNRVIDLDSREIRRVDLFAPEPPVVGPEPLYGTVRTGREEFTGLVQWNRQECMSSDELDGRTEEGEMSLRFGSIRSIARRSRDSSLVTRTDGSEVVLSGTREVGSGNRGIYVDDPRFGRVLISWNSFARLDLSSAGAGVGYGDFPPGQPLLGRVTTRQGDQFVGRLVYDRDESETTETLDAPSRGVDYSLPLGLIASIVVSEDGEADDGPVGVTLHSGEELSLERSGDLGGGNAGLLVFGAGGEHPAYVSWAEVSRIEFDRPPEMLPPSNPQ